eukprot:15447695-Alexandrium_andersonii.AAC.1
MLSSGRAEAGPREVFHHGLGMHSTHDRSGARWPCACRLSFELAFDVAMEVEAPRDCGHTHDRS